MWSFWWHKDKIPTRIFSYYFLVFIQRYLPIYIDSYALRIHSMIADTASHFRLLRRRREEKNNFFFFILKIQKIAYRDIKYTTWENRSRFFMVIIFRTQYIYTYARFVSLKGNVFSLFAFSLIIFDSWNWMERKIIKLIFFAKKL